MKIMYHFKECCSIPNAARQWTHEHCCNGFSMRADPLSRRFCASVQRCPSSRLTKDCTAPLAAFSPASSVLLTPASPCGTACPCHDRRTLPGSRLPGWEKNSTWEVFPHMEGRVKLMTSLSGRKKYPICRDYVGNASRRSAEGRSRG